MKFALQPLQARDDLGGAGGVVVALGGMLEVGGRGVEAVLPVECGGGVEHEEGQGAGGGGVGCGGVEEVAGEGVEGGEELGGGLGSEDVDVGEGFEDLGFLVVLFGSGSAGGIGHDTKHHLS